MNVLTNLREFCINQYFFLLIGFQNPSYFKAFNGQQHYI
ncbi:GSCOCG00006077001-RA-CDS [Cotesia congregata]|nr:GSCOCG00006077001-RA-CDS [Cotesia congregata]